MATFGGRYSLWRTTDDGGTWERVLTSSLTDVDTIELIQFSPEYGNGSQILFIAGNSHGSPSIWKSGDNGQSFTIRPTLDPDTGAALPVHAWVAIDDTTLLSAATMAATLWFTKPAIAVFIIPAASSRAARH